MKKNLTIVIASISLILLFILGCLLIMNSNNIKIKKFENENVALEYDNTWKLTNQNENNLKFENGMRKLVLYSKEPSLYKIIFDNRSSWISKKTLFYRFVFLKPIISNK